MMYYYYNTRITKLDGRTRTVMQVRTYATAFSLVGDYPSGSKIEAKLLGFGPPTIRVGRRAFHTEVQAASYRAGYNFRSASSTLPALDDFRDLGVSDADSDESYRQEARECAGSYYDTNHYEGND